MLSNCKPIALQHTFSIGCVFTVASNDMHSPSNKKKLVYKYRDEMHIVKTDLFLGCMLQIILSVSSLQMSTFCLNNTFQQEQVSRCHCKQIKHKRNIFTSHVYHTSQKYLTQCLFRTKILSILFENHDFMCLQCST